MFATISIRAKIISVVAFLLVAMTGMGLLAVMKMRSMNANTVDITTNWMPSVRVLGELRAGVITYRNVIREHMLSETLEEKLAAEKTLGTVIEANTKLRQSYEAMITSLEERALYSEWSKLWEDYKKGTQEVMALSRKEAGKIPHEAHELNSKTVNKIGLQADEILRRDIELNTKGADQAARDADDSYDHAFMLVSLILGAAVVIGIGVSFYLVRDVSRGISSITDPMQALGKGDLSAEVPHRGEKTEIGAMADVLQVFKEALIAKRAADEAAAADAEAKIERGRRVDSITREFETMIGEIVQTVSSASTQLEASASTLTSTADRSQRLATTVAGASEEASTNVQSVASATEEMASSVGEISRQVQESARMAGDAVGQARATTERVSELSKAASRIGDVVELINTIAGQTNLLALNATIEAARAGEAGRGFAVVASEVKALAEQTAKATGEIGQQISGIQAATNDSVGAIKEISSTIERLSEISSAIAAAVEEQGAATQEIARNVQQAAQGTQQVSANITDVQRGATETGTASSQVLSAAQMLSNDSNRLKNEVGKFLSDVRAA
ncbi:MCP four helix bundle domain-containing protein [Bradyrhizobium sp. 180]|uniref:methyl-accepting chemotaxis protein n=1 Tax=unclassified Bradyrhizobium TaxID=2631580 RepID=UPI001FFA41FF|nr:MULTISPECIES: methyl-accepting chemotaxis protein [unclassified Bradyrhizobium]MCK1423424.1 MCP four helix bundle domain-containing protein [Bradyrhizobium sp. CW12]MCK1492418.1 MCP four helix bundle domain-containing protein [Bradyrhizobium sp. 180]MCK1532748.1 MCP four helix bundle domain-containing protein [Bradyrhizobium sp. 182]MCK1644825.1 MCP four helix bundle domain-containing protein [Bradyrhizobium sp. 154]MCK1663736.1 MCP four helix bundle domain-containing protein [Bradyrhizobiu